MALDGYAKAATLLLAAGVEAAAAIVIGLAAIEATIRALLLFIPPAGHQCGNDAKEAVRLKPGPLAGRGAGA